MTVTAIVSLLVALGATGAASLRWLRIAQREHYLAGATTRFGLRWWRSTPLDLALALAGAAGIAASGLVAAFAVVPAVVALVAPRGLGIRGRTSKLKWTRRLVTLSLALAVLDGLALAVGALSAGLHGAVFAAACLTLLNPGVIDAALLATRPLENRIASSFVREATARLQSIDPIVVAVTGSYGKTSTKGYIAHLVSTERATVASPRSYNNRAGLSRTVNEHLVAGTEVLVAEMGAYGPGEIAALCSWMSPRIAVITAIGPAHLERFKSLERTLAAKAEITTRAGVAILNVDDERLAGLAFRLEAEGKRVLRASGSNSSADVAVLAISGGLELRLAGELIGAEAVAESELPAATSNVACAVAVALELGLDPKSVLTRLGNLPVPANRLQRYVAGGGFVVLDDTFNSNPAGARLALARLAAEAPGGRRVLVTPGMIELGRTQTEENAAFGEASAAVVSDLVIVGRTNRRALGAGARRGNARLSIVEVDRLGEAVAWVRERLGPGDAVLYENDLPDHFP